MQTHFSWSLWILNMVTWQNPRHNDLDKLLRFTNLWFCSASEYTKNYISLFPLSYVCSCHYYWLMKCDVSDMWHLGVKVCNCWRSVFQPSHFLSLRRYNKQKDDRPFTDMGPWGIHINISHWHGSLRNPYQCISLTCLRHVTWVRHIAWMSKHWDFRVNFLPQQKSKCGAWSSSTGISSEIVKNAES